MKGEEVVLEEMLACRERRAAIQEEMRKQHHATQISFCMNIPGPIKTNEAIRKAFDKGLESLKRSIGKETGHILEEWDIHEKTGDEAILEVDLPAETIKTITQQIEERTPIGRLYDMDVIDQDGKKLSRKEFRKCLICGKQAQECARSRTHSVKEMQEAIEKLLASFLQN
jgi:holo-ACP synthase